MIEAIENDLQDQGGTVVMNGYEYIISKQIQWAMNHEITLIGSKGKRGRKAYTTTLDQNLFEPLNDETRNSFLNGDGKEILGSPESPAKMQALHSSSALGVNIFQYWQKRGLVNAIATACGFCSKDSSYSDQICFEEKHRIKSKFVVPPNIDVVFHNNDKSAFKIYAVECKFSEAYFQIKHVGLKEKYLEETDLWNYLPALYKLAKEMGPEDPIFNNLHAAQLIKHILGLLKASSEDKDKFKLLYLWYDVLGCESENHREEVEKFTQIAKSDGIHFTAMTYQELIVALANNHRIEHPEYIKYVTERYL